MSQSNFDIPYLEFLGLRSNPFPVTPDADDFFVSSTIEAVITELVHGIISRKGFFVLTGEVGVGKTTISRKILQTLTAEGVRTSLVFHSLLSKQGIIRQINKDFGIGESQEDDLDNELDHLNGFVLRENELGNNCAIIIDDAQNLTWDSLEVVRMISNLESNRDKLVQILLVGQPELLTKLNCDNMRQLKSRIVIQREVTTLSCRGLQKYIDFKLAAAGPGSFCTSVGGLKAIFKITKGNLRQINILMDRCLYLAYSKQDKKLSRQMVRIAARDCNLSASGRFRMAWLVPAVAAMVLFAVVSLNGLYKMPAIFKAVSVNVYSPSLPSARPQPVPATLCRLKLTTPDIPRAVSTFLQGYGLQEYSQRFWEGLVQGKVEQLKKEIYVTTGLQMVKFPVIPPEFNKKLDLLRIVGKNKTYFICFWKPTISIDEFHWHSEGPQILQLQHLLARQGYYSGVMDGIVGRRLLQAITDFQTDLHLPITGNPDQASIFILYNLGARKQDKKNQLTTGHPHGSAPALTIRRCESPENPMEEA